MLAAFDDFGMWVCLPGIAILAVVVVVIVIRVRRDAAVSAPARKPVTPPPTDDDGPLVVVATVSSSLEAQAIADRLVAADIPALPRIDRLEESMQVSGSHLRQKLVIEASVVVPRHLVDAALAVIGRAPAEGSVPDEEVERVLRDGDGGKYQEADPVADE